MIVSLHAPDKKRIQGLEQHTLPNLAIMKLSAWHKARGDEVWINSPLADPFADEIYVSYIFTVTAREHSPRAIVGGAGSGNLELALPDEIEHIMPDYGAFDWPHAMGFASRGCTNDCPWCVVPKKEGELRAHAHPEEFVRADQTHVTFLDNNILAAPNGPAVLEWCEGYTANNKCSVDFNQGLDSRLIDKAAARQLRKIRIRPYPRLACDYHGAREPLLRALENLRVAGVPCTHSHLSVFVLVGFSGELTEEDRDRVDWVEAQGVDAFAMPYMPIDAPPGWMPSPRLKRFARWVNRKEIYKSVTFEEYLERMAPDLL